MVHQEPMDALKTLWGLQGFAVFSVEIEFHPSAPGRRVKVLRLEDRRKEHQCPTCQARHRNGVFAEAEPRRWRDCSLGDFLTYVEITPWRIACCGGTRVEVFPWEAEGHRMTRRFFNRVAALCTRMPVETVAELVDLSWDTVARVDKNAIELALGGPHPPLDGLSWIGVDEVSRTGGHVYFTIVSDLVEGKVVWIGDGKGEKALSAFFKELGPKRRRKIRGVVTDLAGGYLLAITQYIPHAQHILDRFHIVQWLNEALNQLRRRLFGAAPDTEPGRRLKTKKWLLLKAHERLKPAQKLLLRQLMKLNRPLYRAYLLKEQLRHILHYRWRYKGALKRNLLDWCRAAVFSRLPEINIIGYRLREHMPKVLAGFGAGIRLGYAESVNGIIGLLRWTARGFRNVDYFKLKIFQRCSLPNNPWAKAIF
jgi:transposase